MTFSEKYSKIYDVVKGDIDKIDLISDINIQEPLKTKIFDILNAPSKHIRPLISFLYLRAIGADIDKNQILYQTAIELVHNASLIHDDIIDNSEFRRKIKTLNNEFDSKLAVIAGDYLLSFAMKKVLKIGIPRLTEMFCETLEIMVKGEISQYFGKYKIPKLEEYLKKSEQKTAKLFETSLEGAMIINSHSEQSEKSPKDFAKNFGIAFQIRDDLINCITSKTDINEGVYTAPVIFSDSIDISDIGLEKTYDLLNNYIDKAIHTLNNIEENKYKSALIELLEIYRND